MALPTTPLPPADARALAEAARLLEIRRPETARPILKALADRHPSSADVLSLFAACLAMVGEPGAEAALRSALAFGPRAELYAALGETLLVSGRTEEAERAFRDALAADGRQFGALRSLMRLLGRSGRGEEAAGLAQGPDASPEAMRDQGVLDVLAEVLKGLGRLEEALQIRRRAALAAPRSGVAEHNLAALLGDLGRHVEAAESARRALGKGLAAPETYLVLGRALLGAGRLGEAETAFQAALDRRPLYVDALRDYAQLLWMRTGDVYAASAPLERAARASPGALVIEVLRAKLLSSAGDAAGALHVLEAALGRAPGEVSLRLAASQAAVQAGRPEEGLRHVEGARPTTPGDQFKRDATLCEALLAVGRPEAAARVAASLLDRDPLFQPGIAYLATAWRLVGDPRYEDLYDYDGFIGIFDLEPPSGWSALPAYLDDLAEALRAAHGFKTHPFDQSVRGGSQVPDVLALDHPAVRAFPAAVTPAINRYLEKVGRGGDPFRSRNQGRWRFNGAWSIRLRGGGARHVDHVHPEGWISSAFYVALPEGASQEDREGWIKFGQPGVATRPALDAARYVKPEPGRLVLFPSYMWHGTAPFSGAGERLTIAFDLAP